MRPADVLRRNHVTVSGGGERTVMFANGFGCDQTIWRLVAPSFARDRRVVLFDYVGTGRADPMAYDEDRYGSLDGYALDLCEVAEALGLRGADLVAHSIGCVLALRAALEAPGRFARLVLITPSVRLLNDPPGYFGGFEQPDLDALLDLMDRNFAGWAAALSGMLIDEPELAGALRDTFCALDPRMARRFAELSFLVDARADLPRLRHPSLVLQCARDAVVPAAAAEYIRRHLPGARHVLLEADGHCPHVSHPREVEALVRAYLDAPPADPAGP